MMPGLFRTTMKDIEDAYLVSLCNLIRTQIEKKSFSRKHDTPNTESWEQEARKSTLAALHKTIEALEDMGVRMGYPAPDHYSTDLIHSAEDDHQIPYCKGALLIQCSGANFSNIVLQQSAEPYHTCKFCYLEISDFQVKALKYTSDDWTSIAGCHILASPSFKDRRAAYRCFGCSSRGLGEVRVSAAGMRQHLDSCSSFKEARLQSQSVSIPQALPSRLPPNPPRLRHREASAFLRSSEGSESRIAASASPLQRKPLPAEETRQPPLPARSVPTIAMAADRLAPGFESLPQHTNTIPSGFPTDDDDVTTFERRNTSTARTAPSPTSTPTKARKQSTPPPRRHVSTNNSSTPMILQEPANSLPSSHGTNHSASFGSAAETPRTPQTATSNPPRLTPSASTPTTPRTATLTASDEQSPRSKISTLVEWGIPPADALRCLKLTNWRMDEAANLYHDGA
jgi:hypothetical protein